MKRKKIVLVYDMLKELGGLERMMFMYANCLHRQGYEVELVFGYVDEKESKRITEELELDKSIKIRQLGNSKDYKIQLASFLLNSRGLNCDTYPPADLVISFGFMSSKNAYHESLLKGTPYIVVLCHPPNFLYPSPGNWVNNPIRLAAKLLGVFVGGILRKKDKLYMRNAEKIIVISRYTYKRIAEIYNLFKSKIIYPAISDSFRLMSEKEMDDFKKKKVIKYPVSRKYILAHGRIIPDKNYHSIIPMLKNLDCDLIITGSIDEKYRRFLEKVIERNNLGGRVHILGRVSQEDLVGYYNCASVFVNPAFKEDFGLTPVEAMACGCPVVAWDDGAGPSETIIDRETGILVDCPDGLKEQGLNKLFESGIYQALNHKWDREAIHNSIKRFSKKEIEEQIIKEVKI